MPFDPPVIWFLFGLGLALLEFVVPGVVLIFFAAGAWVTAITTYAKLTPDLSTQIIVFTVASVGLLLGLRHWLHGALYGHIAHTQDAETNLDEFRGQQVKVLKDIGPGRTEAAVEFKGSVWTVISDMPYQKGESAHIVGVEGIALRITRNYEE